MKPAKVKKPKSVKVKQDIPSSGAATGAAKKKIRAEESDKGNKGARAGVQLNKDGGVKQAKKMKKDKKSV